MQSQPAARTHSLEFNHLHVNTNYVLASAVSNVACVCCWLTELILMYHPGKDDVLDIEIDSYIHCISAFVKLAQSEYALLTEIIPEHHQKKTFDSLIQVSETQKTLFKCLEVIKRNKSRSRVRQLSERTSFILVFVCRRRWTV